MSNIVYIAELGVDTPDQGRVFMVEGGRFLDSDDAVEWARAQMGETARAVLDTPANDRRPTSVEQMDDSKYLDLALAGFSVAAYDKWEGETLGYVYEEDAE
jgi:hypothetical protein